MPSDEREEQSHVRRVKRTYVRIVARRGRTDIDRDDELGMALAHDRHRVACRAPPLGRAPRVHDPHVACPRSPRAGACGRRRSGRSPGTTRRAARAGRPPGPGRGRGRSAVLRPRRRAARAAPREAATRPCSRPRPRPAPSACSSSRRRREVKSPVWRITSARRSTSTQPSGSRRAPARHVGIAEERDQVRSRKRPSR